jgi:hypothetical protein
MHQNVCACLYGGHNRFRKCDKEAGGLILMNISLNSWGIRFNVRDVVK